MKKILIIILFALSNVIYSGNINAQNSPVGYWQSLDDVTGQPKAVIRIQKLPNQTLIGHVFKIYPGPGNDQNALCTACDGKKHNQRILGMQIIEDLKQSKENMNEWSNGRILDPSNGKIYNCKIQLMGNSKKLQVRGYLGLPLFGRSQTWIRLEDI